MKKITVKHFLNTNLKPYIINGEKYYSIYMLVTADRKNTKIKSYAFKEYYSEDDFNQIIDKEPNLLAEEKSSVYNIIKLQFELFAEFDTTLFAALYNYLPSIYLLDIDIERIGDDNLFISNQNKLKISLLDFFSNSINETRSNGMSIYTFYSESTQSNLMKFIKNMNPAINIERAYDFINKTIFIGSMQKLQWILIGSKKYNDLLHQYFVFFDTEYQKRLELYNSL